ncbi:carbohydrate ABC transporter permease [Qingrenia yutianensis]|uniref:Carbohydrate ABC transporter permease n=1 Tax=Qingrenia yutianensis TaxID=2763676 RepID=A0A926IS50_9FIRM|nr:carbohydrate ABC transporter permease [Qingrenia yutianensis]MBC8596024.1 carbohydrate ABC transporter permease [Qingrenia yutianensis]
MDNKRNLADTIITLFVLVIVTLITLFPLVYTAASSFKTNAEILAYPERIFSLNPTWDNYKTVFRSDSINIMRMTWNSLYYTIFSVIVVLITSSVSGYVFSRGEFKFKKTIFTIFSSLMFLSFGSVTLYPKFDILTALHLNKSLFGLIVLKCFGIPIVNMYLVRGYVNTLPKELDESAKLDGCSFTGTFFRIIAPLLKPILATVGILTFQNTWNEYLLPAIFTAGLPEQQPLIVGITSLRTSGEAASSWNLMLAGTTIAVIPVLFAYAFGNKYFVAGLANGAVKG